MALARIQFLTRTTKALYPTATRLYSNDEGAIRQSGGAFSKREKAVEDQYFRRLEQEQMDKLKKNAKEHHEEEIEHHEDAIKELKEQIERHKDKIKRHKEKMEDHD
jgi:molecular chaperone GrpE (heat shock protein)